MTRPRPPHFTPSRSIHMSTEEPIAGTEIASALGGTPIAVEEELELEPPPFNDDGTTTDPVAFREWVSSS